MGDFEDKLNAFLSNPDAMAQVMNLAQSLNLGGGENPPPENSGGGPAAQGEGGGMPGGLGNLGGLGELLGQLDPKLIQRLMPLAGELSGAGGGGDERLQLLYALRPFLKEERRSKVERAVKAARLIHVGKKLLTSMGEGDV